MKPCDAVVVAFSNAKDALVELENILDSAGYDLSDINDTMASLYEAKTHLRRTGRKTHEHETETIRKTVASETPSRS